MFIPDRDSPVRFVCKKSNLKAFRKAGKQCGVTVKVLARWPQTYDFGDFAGIQVPRGSMYVELSRPGNCADLSGFWQLVKGEEGKEA